MSSAGTVRKNSTTSTGSLESFPRSEASLKPRLGRFSAPRLAQGHVNVPLCKIALWNSPEISIVITGLTQVFWKLQYISANHKDMIRFYQGRNQNTFRARRYE